MSTILFDIRIALRLLVRSPGFTLAVLGILVLGIGSTTAIFSLVDSVLFKPLPYPHAEDLGVMWTSNWNGAASMSVPDFVDLKEQATTLSEVAASDYRSLSLSADGKKAEHVSGGAVTGTSFRSSGSPAPRSAARSEGHARRSTPRRCRERCALARAIRLGSGTWSAVSCS